MRASLVALASFLVLAASAGAKDRQSTLEALWKQSGDSVTLVQGTSDYAPGSLRVSFLVIRRDGQAVNRPQARVWVADALKAKPFTETRAALEPVGVPGAKEVDASGITKLYVARVRVPRPGKYWILAQPVGGRPIQALGNLVVNSRTASPAVGSRAIASRTPTISSAYGRLELLTTRTPPDTALLRYSVADTLKEHKPFVLVFATPKFCTSRTCGPVVDVVDSVRQTFAHTDIRFIHVEIYKDNKPANGVNQWVQEWRLPTEPWVFLVGRDGRIKAKFEGSIAAQELAAAVRADLK